MKLSTLALIVCLIFSSLNSKVELKVPVETSNRLSVNTLQLTKIGQFGLTRVARPSISEHYHTGIDIKRPNNNYIDEPIYPVLDGIVISIRRDGPYAQIIVEHSQKEKFWTVYEHIADIKIELFQQVFSTQPIARFMNKSELNRYGWQFDHVHFEILKIKPVKLERNAKLPERLFTSYTLTCHTKEELNKYFYNPLAYLKK